jgi:cell division protein FtsZ
MGSSTASGTNRANEAIMKALDSPLLNDNKISGAKNVLLLIVSGSQEITIDEIGEINDHIQTEAGFGANIIMGVGEDESLQESISVTIIATGFNVDQQDEISNTEVKKVVHSLEDDQNQQDLHLDRDPAIIRPDIILETQDHKIVHSLITEEDIVPEVELIDTTDVIRNISVVYDEVLANVEEEEFIIHEVASAESEVEIPSSSSQEDEQTMLTFDLPLTSLGTQSQTLNTKDEDNAKIFNLDDDDDIKEIPVKDYIELIAVTEANEEGETRYALDDYIMLESSMNSSENEQGQEQGVLTEVEEDIVFEKKIIDEIETKEFVEDLDPMNSPISEILKERADERRQKMKEFNYKFNNAKIDDIEKEPAYKRQGVNLDAAQHSSETNASRLSLGTDDNDDIQLRSNNSFLHDNVD